VGIGRGGRRCSAPDIHPAGARSRLDAVSRSDGEGLLAEELAVWLADERELRRLRGRHARNDAFVEAPVTAFERSLVPDLQERAGEEPVEGAVSGILAVLATGQEQHGRLGLVLLLVRRLALGKSLHEGFVESPIRPEYLERDLRGHEAAFRLLDTLIAPRKLVSY